MSSLMRRILMAATGLWLAVAAGPALALPDLGDERTLIILIAASVLFLAVLAIIVILYRRIRPARVEADHEPKAYLNDLNAVTPEKRHELGQRPTMLGRVAGPENSQLNYIVIPESTVGRRHALIEYKDYAYWIIDQGSINGTFVNNKMVASESRLKHGDRIKLHKYEFEFIVPELIDTGVTVVSDTVYKTVDSEGDGDDPSTTGRGIQLSEDDFMDADEPIDDTVHMDSHPVRLDLPLSGPDDDAGGDETIAPGMGPYQSREDTTLQRVAEPAARRRYGPDEDDGESGGSQSRN